MRSRRLLASLFGLSLLLSAGAAGATSRGDGVVEDVAPRLETPALFDDDEGGNADGDDPAIWVHPEAPSRSLVIATKKDAGLSVYDLRGAEAQAIRPPAAPGPDHAPGRFNNADVVYGFNLGGRRVDLAVVTDRGRDQLRVYTIDDGARPLVDVTTADAPFVFSASQEEVDEQATAYGLALWRDPREGATYAFVSERHGTKIAAVRLRPEAGGRVGYEVVRTLTLPATFRLPDATTWTPCGEPGELPQVEGMTVDGDHGALYAAQEDVGIWRIDLDFLRNGQAAPRLIDRVREFGVPATFDEATEECVLDTANDPGFGGQHLSADAEGLTIYHTRGERGYLLASSQGDSTFAVYDRSGSNDFLGSYRIVARAGVDSVEDSDGAAVMNVPLGPAFPLGLLVVHDGANTPDVIDGEGEARANTNFKFIPWQNVALAFNRPLAIDPFSWNPRDP
jgi:3-phytase